MKQFIQKSFWFLALIVVVNLAYLSILMMGSPGFKKVYDVHSFQGKKYDLLIFGNSMALDGIDAQYLQNKGISNYNMAIAGDHIATSLQMFEVYLQNNQKPKVVAIGLSSAIGRSYLNPVPFKNPEVEFFYHPSLLENIINPPLLNFQWLAVDMLKIFISPEHRRAQVILGQWKTQKIIPDHSVYPPKVQRDIDYSNPYLARMIALCRQHQIQVLLLELPGSNSHQDQVPLTRSITLGDGQKCTLHNLNNHTLVQQILDPQKDWLAADHLNEFGAQKVTAYWYETVLKPIFAH